MGIVTAAATRVIDAPPERVMEVLRNYQTRPKLLTDNYTSCRVEAGGKGSGTIFAYHFAAAGRERDYRLSVEETGGSLRERDLLSSYVSEWTVTPAPSGSSVTVTATWNGASGVGGIFEGLFAPLGLKRIFGEVLSKLAAACTAD